MARRSGAGKRGSDAEQLDSFVQRAEQLTERRLLKDGTLNATLDFRFDETTPPVMETSYWDPEDFRSLMVELRPFLMQNESIYLAKVFNTCERLLTSEELKHRLRDARTGWQNSQRGYGVKISVDNRELVPERVVDLLLNAKMFHVGSSEEREELARMGPVEKLLSDHVFQNFVVDAIRIVLYVAQTIRVAQRDGHFDFSRGEG